MTTWDESRSFEFEHEGKWYYASVWEEFGQERFGADADGNRGVNQTMRVAVDVVNVWDEEGKEVEDDLILAIAKEAA